MAEEISIVLRETIEWKFRGVFKRVDEGCNTSLTAKRECCRYVINFLKGLAPLGFIYTLQTEINIPVDFYNTITRAGILKYCTTLEIIEE